MKLSPEDVLRLGSLSRISIADTDLPQLTADLNHILEFAAVLGEIDPALPEYGFDAGGNILRVDEAAARAGRRPGAGTGRPGRLLQGAAHR